MRTFNLERLVRANVKGLTPYSSARDEYAAERTAMVFLDANENPFDNGLNRYPDPQQRELKSALAKIKGVTVENILIGNGSDEVLDLIFRAFCEPKKDNILTLPPTYGMYKVLAGINDVRNIEVGLTNGLEPNFEKILKLIGARTKLIFFCSPNNPTGNSFQKEIVKKVLKRFRGLVVIDEAYIDFSQQDSWLKELEDYPNLIVTQTLSKAYGMAGIRLGICYASKEVIKVLNKVKPPYNVNELTQQKALSAVLDQESVEKEVQKILSERERLREELATLPFVEKIFNTDANFVLVRVDDADKRYKQLLESGIVVRNRSSQYLCEETLRFTVGTPKENAELIATLKNLK